MYVCMYVPMYVHTYMPIVHMCICNLMYICMFIICLVKGYPTVDGEVVSTGITLAHFKAPNDCTYSAFTITNNPISPDAVHPLQMNEVIKLDIPQENLVYFYDPNPDWIVQEVRI